VGGLVLRLSCRIERSEGGMSRGGMKGIPWGVFMRAVREAASLAECEEMVRRILADDWRPNCSRCGQPVGEVWALTSDHKFRRLPFERLDRTDRSDPLVRWLCADCTDEVAAALGNGSPPGAEASDV